MRIELKHLTRVEGHANLVIDTSRRELKDCRIEIIESPRFFESILRGRHFSDVAPISSRICGVCSNSHTLVSLAATEAALKVEISEQTQRLRRLLAYGEILQSHLLHLYFLALPDYLRASGIFPLTRTRKDVVTRALRMKKLANDICQVIGGRPVHPVTPCVGGFSALPEASSLKDLRRRLLAVLPDLEATIDLFASFSLPSFSRPTEYLSLGGESGYPLFGNHILSSAGPGKPVAEYKGFIEEYLVPHSNAKFAKTERGSFQVGPLARFKNSFRRLSPMAAKVAEALELSPESTNPFSNLLARLVEVAHCVEEAIHSIDTLLVAGLSVETVAAPTGGGSGVAAIEAPRGVLFHAYEYDDTGRIERANCIIPTAQNLANIETDLRAFIPTVLALPREEMVHTLEMLLRAYDPCISCATHFLRVEIV